jgi:ribosome biogenesis GTPase / thiamine phosphate phosphatase
LVIKAISGFYTVHTAVDELYVCKLPGRLKREKQQTDIVAVGDRVTFAPDAHHGEKTGLITAVAERQRVLSRSRPSAHARQLGNDREQVLVANPDQVLFVCSLKDPEVSLRKIDRFLVMAEREELPAVICVNKIDLGDLAEAQILFQPYEQIGYSVLYTSVKTGLGLADLRACLRDKISVLSGSSGVGKSSLLNTVQTDLGRKVHAVSEATGKGLHTTRYAELIPLEGGGYVADTPGIRGVALYDIEPDELDGYFREIAPLVAQCQFSDCTHQHEPGCAVRTAVDDGRITFARYDSYLRLREEHEALEQSAY